MKLLQVWGQSWPRLAFGCQRARRSDRLAFTVPVLISDLVYDTWGSKGLESVSQEQLMSNSKESVEKSQVLKKRHPLHGFCHIPVFSENLHSFQSPRHPILLDGPLAVNATAHLALENAVFVAAQGDIAWAA